MSKLDTFGRGVPESDEQVLQAFLSSSTWDERGVMDHVALEVEVIHRRIWIWDGSEPQVREWHLVVRREVKAPQRVKYSLSNAPTDTPMRRLASTQGNDFGSSVPSKVTPPFLDSVTR